jgi:hypothetical protein
MPFTLPPQPARQTKRKRNRKLKIIFFLSIIYSLCS